MRTEASRQGVEVRGAPGLDGVRAALERQPRHGITPRRRDPSEVRQEQALEALKLRWADLYHLAVCGGWFTAIRRQPPRHTLGAASAEELDLQLARDWGSW